MSKFNLFAESAWKPEPITDQENIINNRAVGTIGQITGRLYAIRRQLRTGPINGSNNPSYEIAIRLREKNLTAFQTMEVEIVYLSQISDIVKDIQFVLDQWSEHRTQEARVIMWRSLMPALHRLKHVLDHEYHVIKALQGVIEVKGNAAWDVYLESQLECLSLKKELLKSPSIVDDDNDSSDAYDYGPSSK